MAGCRTNGRDGQCDIRGFIPVDDLQRLPELDARLSGVSLRTTSLELPVPHWKPSLSACGGGNWPSPRYAISPLATLLARQLLKRRNSIRWR